MSNPQQPRPMLAAHSRKRSGSVATHDHTPTTPRLNARFSDQPAQEIPPSAPNDLSTPTRRDFGGISGQRPLPEEPFTPSRKGSMSRENSRRSVHSHQSSDSQDVEMGDDDEEGRDRLDDSDDSASSEKPSRKKKKGQRFYCTDFPPCQLSFTRSEHLARHIRKHTGERPFECHCSRRFSRLDNLRQHAQTVHVNEEIPGDSLAATGTRFQRQIRTDRVRPPNVRPRASTASSQGGTHSRGHSRNLSASSITSTTSSVGLLEDSVPHPSPLAIAQDPTARARLSLDTFNPAINGMGQYGYYQQSPSGYSSPTSATFSTGASSPRFTSGMQSPPQSLSRSSFYNGSRAPARRLSVPSGVNPFQASNQTYPPLHFAPLPSNPTQYSNTTSVVTNPPTSGFSHHRRAESDAELEWRRRTWHPGTHPTYSSRPATSGLTYHQTPDDAVPALAPQPAASQITRLPGIESFDHAPPPPTVPARNVTSPVQGEQGGRPLVFPGHAEGTSSGPVHRRISSGWEAGLHHNLTKLDIAKAGPSTENQGWAAQARALANERPTTAPHTGFHQQPAFVFPASRLQPAAEIHTAAEQGVGDRLNKRQAWYGGPVAAPQGSQPIMIAHRTSPESSSSEGVPTPSTSQGRELHPAIMHANGLVELQPPETMLTEEKQKAIQAHYQGKPEPVRADSGFHSYVHVPGQIPAVYMMQTGIDPQQQQHEWRQQNAQRPGDMGRLDALAAVAISENRAVEHRS